MKFVTAKKPLNVKHGKNPDNTDHVVAIPTEYRQFESLEEAEQDAGGRDGLLKYVNASVKADSATPVRNFKAAEGTKDEEVISKASALRKNWSIKNSVSDTLTQREKAEAFDEVSKLIESGASKEDVLAAIRKARGAEEAASAENAAPVAA